MLKLNILPSSIKTEKKIFSFYASLKTFMYIGLIIVSVFAIIFLILMIILEIHFTSTVFQTSGVIKKAENFSKKIFEINQQINNVSEIQQDSIHWTAFFIFLSENTPNEIKFNQIKIDKENNSFDIGAKFKSYEFTNN